MSRRVVAERHGSPQPRPPGSGNIIEDAYEAQWHPFRPENVDIGNSATRVVLFGTDFVALAEKLSSRFGDY
jgi:hypothetical protein